jgi:hypothetical protein
MIAIPNTYQNLIKIAAKIISWQWLIVPANKSVNNNAIKKTLQQ